MRNLKLNPDDNPFCSPRIRAAEYMRMSTERQTLSIDFQCGAIRAFAARRGMAVVRTYIDHAKSGLTSKSRAGLQSLISDVQTGKADYSVILVYDVSRWGRYQDIDEGAYYEHLCKRFGVRVTYCVEQFDDTPMAGVLKSISRTMAGEYSRNLSARVWGGLAQIAAMGFKPGGLAGFGMRRLLINAQGKPKCILEPGTRKGLQSDHVILIPGPREEIETVWKIYDWFVLDRMREDDIVDVLNKERRPDWPVWTRKIVHNILTCPKYAGENVFNRRSAKLRTPQRKNPEGEWIRCPKAFRGLVTPEMFEHVQKLVRQGNRRRYSDRWLKRKLWDLLQAKGELSAALIRSESGMPSTVAYTRRFGGLRAAYESVGYCRLNHRTFLENSHDLSARRSVLARDLVERFLSIGIAARWVLHWRLIEVSKQWTLSLNFLRSYIGPRNELRWHSEFKGHTVGDMLLIIRMNRGNTGILDYHFIPRTKLYCVPKVLTERAPRLASFRSSGFEPRLLLEAKAKWPEARQHCHPWEHLPRQAAASAARDIPGI